jgi:hypothetical protein
MRDDKKPELLKDKINYQVMGANEWRHAPSLEKMSDEMLTLYLTDKKTGDQYQLSREKPSRPGFLYQEWTLLTERPQTTTTIIPIRLSLRSLTFPTGSLSSVPHSMSRLKLTGHSGVRSRPASIKRA